jgi:hypothetical protein
MMLFNEHNSQPPIIQVDKEDEMHQMAVCGRYVIQRLNRKYWSHEIFPATEIRYSRPPSATAEFQR